MANVEGPPSFGPLLRHHRITAGLTQEELAERTGLGVRSIQHLEGGAHLPHRETVTRLIRGLGLAGEDQSHFERSAQPSPRPREAGSPPAGAAPDDHAEPRHNLPAQLTSFVGREDELAEVRRLLGASRLLTITGVGGTGKTRLALQIAATLLDSYPDGVWFVDLAPLADPALVAQTVAGAVGIPEQSGQPILTTLLYVLRARKVLLSLDNCEHLIDACARLAETVLKACPEVQILATSREGLGIAGEVSWSLPSLPVPTADWQTSHRESGVTALGEFAAIRLFLDRARAADPAFEITDQNAAAVVQICRRVDGIPLAIELAAARVKVFSVERMAGRLDDLFRLLTGGSRTALPRHQTMRALIDWSYNLLAEPERALFHRLSVFVGGFTIEAIEGVCAGAGIDALAVPDLLAQLVGRSLVVVDREERDRYRLLETLRHYGRDRLIESGKAEALRDRHRDWFLQLAERAKPELIGPDQVIWLDRLEGEHDNLRAALEWAVEGGPAILGLRLVSALWRLWDARDYLAEGKDWMTRVLATPGASKLSSARADVLRAAQEVARHLDLIVARPLAEECLAIYQALDDRPGIAWALNGLAWVVFSEGDLERAEELGREALKLAREADAPWVMAQAMEALGDVAHQQNNDSLACQLYEDCLVVFRELGDHRAILSAVGHLGSVSAGQGKHEKARAYYQEGLTIARTMRNKMRISWMLTGLGDSARLDGDFGTARAFLEENLVLARERGAPRAIGVALVHLGSLVWAEGESGRAAILIKESIAAFRDGRGRAELAVAVSYCGMLAVARGTHRRGARLLGAGADPQIARQTLPGWWQGPDDRRAYDESLKAARASLDDDEFARAWAEGRALTLEQAVAYALEEDDR